MGFNLRDLFGNTAGEIFSGVKDIVDETTMSKEEKAEANYKLKQLELTAKEKGLDAEAALLADRQSARLMAGVHKKLQKAFALSFLVFFFVLVMGEFAFLGMLIKWTLSDSAPIPEWLQVLIASLLSGTLGYCVSILKEIAGFLFGGSIGGDANGEAMIDAMRQGPQTIKESH